MLSHRRRLGGSLLTAVMVALALLSSRVLGFVRESVVAAFFGAGTATDMYIVAATLPIMLYQILDAAFSATLVPVFIQAMGRSKDDGFRFASNVINTSTVVSVGIWALAYFFAQPIVRVISPGFTGETLDAAVSLSRVILPSIVGFGLASVLTGVLQAREHITIPAMVPFAYNLGIVLCTVLLAKHYGMRAVAWGTTLGAFAQVAIQLPLLLVIGYRHSWVLDFRDPRIIKIARLMVPVLLSMVATQLLIIPERFVISGLGAGNLSAINYGWNVFSLPMSIFVAAIVTAAYPRLAKTASTGTPPELGGATSAAIETMMLVIIPSVVILALQGQSIVRLLYQRGVFDANATARTYRTLLGYSGGLVAAATFEVLQRSFFAAHDTSTPMLLSSVRVGIHIVLDFLLVASFGVIGVPLAYSISMSLIVVYMGYVFYRRFRFEARLLFTSVCKLVASGLGMAAVVWFAGRSLPMGNRTFFGEALRLGIISGLGLLVFLVIATVVRVPQLEEVRRKISVSRAIAYLSHD